MNRMVDSQTIPANAVQYPSDITAAIDAIAKRLEATGAKHARWTATQVLENAELASELPLMSRTICRN